MTIKDWKNVKANSANLVHLIFNKEIEYFQEINGNKYLTLVPNNESKKKKIIIIILK